MDLLGSNPAFNLYDRTWRIFSRTEAKPPQYVGDSASVVNSMVTEGCEIYGTVINSVLGSGVYVEPGAVVRDSVVLSNTRIEKNAEVLYSIIDGDVTIGESARVGEPKEAGHGIAVVGSGITVGASMKIEGGAMIATTPTKA